MPRPRRVTFADGCYHVINRGNGRANVFHTQDDFLAFERILSLACERVPMRILAWCLMHNHFHLVLWPRRDGDLADWMQWVTTCHVRRYHRHYRGSGHVWQGRYKCFAAQPGKSLMTVLRYVERNPVRAGMVSKAQDWRFSSAAAWAETGSGSRRVPDPVSAGSARAAKGVRHRNFAEPDPFSQAPFPSGKLRRPENEPDPSLAHWLVRGPAPRPQPWLRFVNREEEADQLARLRECVNRGAPFGNPTWREKTARKLGLESAVRPRGRPRKEA
jgi:putative transposase